MNYLLIGKPNVGKSSIYNILTGSNLNIVHSKEGTTRNWHREYIKDTHSYIYDTPGILINDKQNKEFLNVESSFFTNESIQTLLYVVDYKNGFNEFDRISISNIRKLNKKIKLIINKFDNYKESPNEDFFRYGIKDFLFISCSHRFGIDKLFSKISNKQLTNAIVNENKYFSIAIFGKPNVGKSTFTNTLLGYKRSKTNSVAGTTSDHVIDVFNYKKNLFKIIDTAGIGKKANIKNKSINYYSVKKTFDRITLCDTAILIIDSTEGVDRQDKRLIKLLSTKSQSIILLFNKFDLITNKESFQSQNTSFMNYNFNEIRNKKFFFISSLVKKNVINVIEYILNEVIENEYVISTSKLNKWLKNVIKENQHPLIENKKVNFKYAVQIKNRPVTIKIFCNYSSKLKQNYKRYLINNFNYHFKILNQKTRIIFSSSVNPYV